MTERSPLALVSRSASPPPAAAPRRPVPAGRLSALCAALAALPPFATPAAAATTPFELVLPPAAEQTAAQAEAPGSYRLPVGPWLDGKVAMLTAEGAVDQTAWRIRARATTLELLQPLRDQLASAGFQTLFECETDVCGGFDFRYAAEVLPEPDMHVDLGDFRFLAARRGEGVQAEYVSLWVSRSSDSGYVELAHIGPPGSAPLRATESSKSPEPAFADAAPAAAAAPGDLAGRLEASGAVALDDLVFESGSATLGDGDYPSLAALAGYLSAHPERRVALVGHTDAVGGLDANIALSKRRAASVAERLAARYGTDPGQLSAEGVGYLAPRASNLTEDGRIRNRRVEAMLVTTN